MPAPDNREIFVAYPWALYERRASYKQAYTSMEAALKVKFVFAEQRVSSGHVLTKIRDMIEQAAFGVYDVSGWNANVTMEYGMALGMGRKTFIAFNPAKTELGDVPSDVRGYDRLQYRDLEELTAKVESLVVQELGTGIAVDRLETDRRQLVSSIKTNPGRTVPGLAELTGFEKDYIQMLIRRSGGELRSEGATRATKYFYDG